jgi:deoxycytidine triphosphate deaminase
MYRSICDSRLIPSTKSTKKNGASPESHLFIHHRELTKTENDTWEPLIFSMQEFIDVKFSPAEEEGGEPVENKIIPYGLVDHGYTIHLSVTIRQLLPKGKDTKPVDPLNVKTEDWIVHNVPDSFVLQPNENAIGYSMEYFVTPESTTGFAVPEQRYLDLGLLIQVEPIGGNSKGRLSVSMLNVSARPIRIYTHQGIATMLFFDLFVTTAKPMLQ